MIRFVDILIELFLLIVFFISSILILEFSEYPFLVLIVFIVYISLHFYIKSKRKLTKYVNSGFLKLGYQIIGEKYATNGKSIEFKVEPIISGIPASRFLYIRRYGRLFTVKDKNNDIYELNTTLTLNWNMDIEIEINTKNQIS